MSFTCLTFRFPRCAWQQARSGNVLYRTKASNTKAYPHARRPELERRRDLGGAPLAPRLRRGRSDARQETYLFPLGLISLFRGRDPHYSLSVTELSPLPVARGLAESRLSRRRGASRVGVSLNIGSSPVQWHFHYLRHGILFPRPLVSDGARRNLASIAISPAGVNIRVQRA